MLLLTFVLTNQLNRNELYLDQLHLHIYHFSNVLHRFWSYLN